MLAVSDTVRTGALNIASRHLPCWTGEEPTVRVFPSSNQRQIIKTMGAGKPCRVSRAIRLQNVPREVLVFHNRVQALMDVFGVYPLFAAGHFGSTKREFFEQSFKHGVQPASADIL